MYNQAGTLLLASRMKRLGDRLFSEIIRVYRGLNVPFEPSWFPIFYLLNRDQSHSVSSIAREMGVTDSAVSQLIRQLKDRDLIGILPNTDDKRAGTICLSNSGKQLLSQVKPIWQAIETTLEETLTSGRHGSSLLYAMTELESSLDTDNLSRQIKDRVEVCRLEESFSIIPASPTLTSWINEVILSFTIRPHPSWRQPAQYILNPENHPKTDFQKYVLMDAQQPIALLITSQDHLDNNTKHILFCASKTQPAAPVEDFFLSQFCQLQTQPSKISVHLNDKNFLFRLHKIGFRLNPTQLINSVENIDLIYYPDQKKKHQEPLT